MAKFAASGMWPLALVLAAAGVASFKAVLSMTAFSTPVQHPQKDPSLTRLRPTSAGSRASYIAEDVPASSGVMTTFGASALIAWAASQFRRRRTRQRSARMATATATAPVTAPVKKDLTGALPDCPPTVWNANNIEIGNLPDIVETAPFVIDALKNNDELRSGSEAFFAGQRDHIMDKLQKHGAILFQNFDMMMDADGFRRFYEALQLNPCLDPIHTSGLRDMIGKKDAVYEAVNKPSLSKHFVGLHNESTFVKTATYGAFVCFKPATEGGGEFLIADGAKIIKDMKPDVLRRTYEKQVRIAVSNLDMNFVDMLPSDYLKDKVKSTLQDVILKTVAPKFDMDLEMLYGADNSNPYRLQAIEHAQSPINTHPVTGQPVWFCNLHNHSRYLRDRRECSVPEVGMTDVFYGDLSAIPPDDVEHINEVCERNIVPIMMKRGDVLLLDNYRVLHGRNTFKGERKHAVTWFESCGEPLQREIQREKPDDFMNILINKTLV